MGLLNNVKDLNTPHVGALRHVQNICFELLTFVWMCPLSSVDVHSGLIWVLTLVCDSLLSGYGSSRAC